MAVPPSLFSAPHSSRPFLSVLVSATVLSIDKSAARRYGLLTLTGISARIRVCLTNNTRLQTTDDCVDFEWQIVFRFRSKNTSDFSLSETRLRRWIIFLSPFRTPKSKKTFSFFVPNFENRLGTYAWKMSNRGGSSWGGG